MEGFIDTVIGVQIPPKPHAVFLNEQEFFHGIPWSPLERLAAMASFARFAADEVIFAEGAPADRFLVLLRGNVALQTGGMGVEPTVIEMLEAGDALGWSWLFAPYRWSFTAVARDPVESVAMSAEVLRSLCEEDPVLGCALMRRISGVMLNRLQATRRRLAVLQQAAAGIPLRITVAGGPADRPAAVR